jgi:hypothetical protein
VRVIAFLVRTAVKMLMAAALLYVAFFVPVGRFTLYEHFARIAGTDEAKELGGEVGEVIDVAREEVQSRVGELASRQPE